MNTESEKITDFSREIGKKSVSELLSASLGFKKLSELVSDDGLENQLNSFVFDCVKILQKFYFEILDIQLSAFKDKEKAEWIKNKCFIVQLVINKESLKKDSEASTNSAFLNAISTDILDPIFCIFDQFLKSHSDDVNNQGTQREFQKLVISGFGPSALAAAFAAIKFGFDITIISNRKPGFTRSQGVHLSDDYKEYLKEMSDFCSENQSRKKAMSDFFKKNIQDVFFVRIGHIEEYIYDCLILLAGSLNRELTIFHESEISRIDMENGVLSVKSPKNQEITQIHDVDYLVGADGVKRHALNVLNEGREQPLIKLGESATAVLPRVNFYKYHVHAELSLESINGENLCLPKDTVLFHVIKNPQIISDSVSAEGSEDSNPVEDQSADQVYTLYADAKSYQESHGKKTRYTVVGELTDEQSEKIKGNPEEIMNYVKKIMLDKFESEGVSVLDIQNMRVDAISREDGRKDLQRLQVFQQDFLMAKPSCVDIFDCKTRKTRYFLLIGDAFYSPFYQLGHGLENAFKEVKWFEELMGNGITLSDYNAKCCLLSSVNNLSMHKFSIQKETKILEIEQLLKQELPKLEPEFSRIENSRSTRASQNRSSFSFPKGQYGDDDLELSSDNSNQSALRHNHGFF